MTIKNALLVFPDKQFVGYISFSNGKITDIGEGEYKGDDSIDAKGNILMPGFIDIHIHGSNGIDFMDANESDYENIANSLYSEGVTTFLATTLTSGKDSLDKVCRTVKNIKEKIPSLGGIHFEGPYINEEYKGAQNPEYIRDPDITEFKELFENSGKNIKLISLAPERNNALNFISEISKLGVISSAGHTKSTFKDIDLAISKGLTNITHAHNAMTPHHHRNPGVVSAAFYFDNLYTEFICDKIHVCPESLKTSFKIIGEDRFIIITDALKAKHSELEKFDLFGLPCIKKEGAAYLESGPLAGSLLTLDQGVRNMKELCNLNLSQLSKISSRNAAKSLKFSDRGELKVGYLADFVLLDKNLHVLSTYKLGKKVY